MAGSLSAATMICFLQSDNSRPYRRQCLGENYQRPNNRLQQCRFLSRQILQGMKSNSLSAKGLTERL